MEALQGLKAPITTTELANITGIDIRNITRYLKPLENEGKIIRNTIQDGKLRLVKITLRVTPFTPKEVVPLVAKPAKSQIYDFTPRIKFDEKEFKVIGDKKLSRKEMIEWLVNYLKENEEYLKLDWLRGQKYSYESIVNLRKILEKK